MAVFGFEMKVVDVFRFADGRTVFFGHIKTTANFIGPCACELLVDGNREATLRLEGEIVPDPLPADGSRVLCTRDQIGIVQKDAQVHDCRLRAVDVGLSPPK
jgi:hypothetical protein